MGQFKPMVKMMTTEPSVELKLKKGGHVSMKHGKEEHGHKRMPHMMDGGLTPAMSAAMPARGGMMPTASPAKPSMAARRRAMAAPMVSAPPATMKKGGKAHHHAKGGEIESKKEHKAEMHELHKLEKELKHHEHEKAGKAHHGLKHGGKVKHHASGGKIDSAETKTTLKNSVKPFAKTEMHEAHHDSVHGTGVVKEGKPGGFKRGGKVHHKATGGKVSSETTSGNFDVTEMHQAKRDRAHGTGAVHESNAGGFKKGGHAKKHHYAAGGTVAWENRPADTAHAGVSNRTTGGVKEGNAGGFKKGGHAKKYARGGSVVQDDGRAEKMPQGHKKPSAPVSITSLSGTFKKGGRVKHMAAGGGTDVEDLSKGAYDRALSDTPTGYGFAKKVHGAIDRFFGADKTSGKTSVPALTGGVPAGSVTKTEKSVTVAPGKKRGGKVC